MIHYFNPGHETAILNKSKYYTSPTSIATMQKDLAYLPAWYAASDDYVLVDDDIPHSFVDFFKNYLNLSLAKNISRSEINKLQNDLVKQSVSFWGITPQAIHLFEMLNDQYQLNWDIPHWKDTYIDMCSRKTAQNCLLYILDNTTRIASDIVPQFYTTLDEIETVVAENKTTRFLAKAPFSSSGRGLLWLPLGGLTRTERQILQGHLKKQGTVSLERSLDKKLDFAMEFILSEGTVSFEGLSLFKTNAKGVYQGNIIADQEQLENIVSEYVDRDFLREVKQIIFKYLTLYIAPEYNGYVGIDMLIYEENGDNHLQPCIEINLRNNMGVVALNVARKLLADNTKGDFFIDFSPTDGQMLMKHKEMTDLYPIVIKNNKIKSGYLVLCPVNESTKYRAYVLV